MGVRAGGGDDGAATDRSGDGARVVRRVDEQDLFVVPESRTLLSTSNV